MPVKHRFQSTRTSTGGSGVITPADWNADHIIDAGTFAFSHMAPDASGMELLAAPVLGSSAATLSSGTFAARDQLLVFLSLMANVGGHFRVTFNGETGLNCWTRSLRTNGRAATQGGASTFLNSQDNSRSYLRLSQWAPGGGIPFMATLIIGNRLATVKPVQISPVDATGGPTDMGEVESVAGEWVNTTAQVTSIVVGLSDTHTLAASSTIIVFGKNF